MRLVLRFHDQFHRRDIGRQGREEALVLDLDDIAAERAHGLREFGQRAGPVGNA